MCIGRSKALVYVLRRTFFTTEGSNKSNITNIICYRLDRRLLGFANSLQCSFTRYADDITFGYDDPDLSEGRVIQGIKKIVEDEDFFIHPEKNKVMHNGRRKEVTGVVVNTKKHPYEERTYVDLKHYFIKLKKMVLRVNIGIEKNI